MVVKKPVEKTYRAFSTKKETTYGTALALASATPYRLKHIDNVRWQEPGDIVTDKDEHTGFAGIAERTARKRFIEFTHEQRFLVHPAILMTSLLFGNVSSVQQGTTAAYRHDMTPQTAVELPSATMWQGNPLTGDKVFAGIGCVEIKVTAEQEKFVKWASSMIGSGLMATGVDISGVALPPGEAYLAWEDCDLLIGGTFNGSDVTGGTSIKDKVRKLELTMKNGGKREYQMGGDGTFADALVLKNTKLEDRGVIDLEISPGDTTELDYIINETENVVEFKLVGGVADTGYNFTYSVVFPVARFFGGALDRDEGIQTASLKIVSQKDNSANDYPEIYAYGINKVSLYLG